MRPVINKPAFVAKAHRIDPSVKMNAVPRIARLRNDQGQPWAMLSLEA
jgi:hypothetical protein